jgi:hypothetical protein
MTKYASSVRTHSKAHLLTLRRTASSVADELAKYRNVSFVTIGAKRIKGRRTPKRAFVVYVSKKGDVSRPDRIPSSAILNRGKLKGTRLPTDVVELPSVPQAFGIRSGDIVFAGDGDFGTNCLGFVKDGAGYIVTNAHVIGDVRQRRVFGTPEIQEPATHKHFPLGAVEYISPFTPGATTNEDIAIVRAGNIAVDHLCILNEQFPIKRFGDFAQDVTAQYWYNTNGARVTCRDPEPVPVGHSVPILVDGLWYPYTGFWALEVSAGVPAKGHSGSIVCRGSGTSIEACGILFGGAPPNYAYVLPLQPTLSRIADNL